MPRKSSRKPTTKGAAPTTTPAAPKLLLSIREAAATLGVDPSTLYAILAQGGLVSFTVGKRRFIRAGTLEAWIAEQEAHGSPPDGTPHPGLRPPSRPRATKAGA